MIPKKPRKARKTSLPALITKADKVTSQYIRKKASDHAGMVKCVSCNTVSHWKDMHCAHYIGRAAKSTRWEEENLHPACPSCNVYRKEHHMREYTLYMIDMYGRDKIDELKEEARKVLSGSQVRQLAEEAILYYTESLNSLER